MLINGKLECNWYIHVTCTLILNVFIVISAITMNARGNGEWLTSHKLCYNLFKKFSFKMRQSKCCWLIRGERVGGCVWVLFAHEGSYGAFAVLLWLAWVTPSLLPSFFLIKALGLDLQSSQCRNFSAILCLCHLLGLSLIYVVSVGLEWEVVGSVPPSRALCSKDP